MTAVDLFILAVGAIFVALSILSVVFIVLAFMFELRQRRRARRGNLGLAPFRPMVSVVVPAYNEERVIDACVDSILRCGYPHLEVILVDDGSKDSTPQRLRAWEACNSSVRAIIKPNGGKGSALNAGALQARGEILMFVDADGLFTPQTIPAMLRAFASPRVGAACGNDRPANLDRVLTKFLATISHVGTGMVRRALHMLNCVPVVSGNIGAFRREALLQAVIPGVGPLRTDTVGEDLELTWRLRLAGWQIAFEPDAVVYAESPSTLLGLWKQRVRWARGLLQSLKIHRRSIGSRRHGIFGYFLVYQAISAVAVPVIQAIGLAAGAVALAGGWTPGSLALRLGLLALITSGVTAAYAMALDDAPEHLRHMWTIPFWPLYSLAASGFMVRAIFLEANHRPNAWNKLERTGVVSAEAKIRGDRPVLPIVHGPVHAVPSQPNSTSVGLALVGEHSRR